MFDVGGTLLGREVVPWWTYNLITIMDLGLQNIQLTYCFEGTSIVGGTEVGRVGFYHLGKP